MGIVSTIIDVVKRKKKMKTLVTIPNTNFQSLTQVVSDNGEIQLSGLDGNGVAVDQTLAVQSPCAIFFDTATRNFVSVKLEGDIPSTFQQLGAIVREVV